jgi:hypothetical protein
VLLRFVAPQLAQLDRLESEVLVACVYEDARPAHGVAGLYDWRLCGRLSRLMQEQFLTGQVGEVLMLPGKPRTSFDKLVLFGAGERSSFDEARFVRIATGMLGTLSSLRARSAVVELPGRFDGRIAPARAAELLLASVASSDEHDTWTLIERPADQALIEAQLAERQRLLRRMPPAEPPG